MRGAGLFVIGTHVRVQIESPLRVDGNTLPRVLDSLVIQVRIDDIFLLLRLGQHIRARIHNQAVTVGVVRSAHVSSGTAQGHIHLVINGSSTSQQRPVQRTGGGVESARVDEHEGAFPSRNHAGLWEANIVTDGQSNLTIVRQIYHGQLVTRGQDLALLKGDLAGDVDIEEMSLAVGSNQGTGGGEHQRGVVVLFRGRLKFRNATTHQVGLGFCGDGRKRMVGGGLFLGGWGRKQCLGVLGKVLGTVGGVETFRKDDERGTSFGGFKNLGASMRKVYCLVGA